jgi:hypothetical protein
MNTNMNAVVSFGPEIRTGAYNVIANPFVLDALGRAERRLEIKKWWVSVSKNDENLIYAHTRQPEARATIEMRFGARGVIGAAAMRVAKNGRLIRNRTTGEFYRVEYRHFTRQFAKMQRLFNAGLLTVSPSKATATSHFFMAAIGTGRPIHVTTLGNTLRVFEDGLAREITEGDIWSWIAEGYAFECAYEIAAIQRAEAKNQLGEEDVPVVEEPVTEPSPRKRSRKSAE